MSNVLIPESIDPQRRARYEQMIQTLLQTMGGNVEMLSAYLMDVEAKSKDRKQRDLARQLIRHVFDRKYVVNLA